ncbi:MAG: hypothetical protein Q4D26_09875 [Clostridia bacterium]|nr:hypothetical protein [Clostridia bacterium]
MYSKGQIVFSKSGRDKGRAFIVYDYNDTYVFIVDGDLRKLEKPKKKKKIHIQISKHIDEEIKNKLENELYILNSDIKKALAKYNNKMQRDCEGGREPWQRTM